MTFLPLFVALLSPAAGPAPPCEPIPGAGDLLRPGVVLLLGEIHGTVEAPDAVSSLVCEALGRGLSVTVGLEFPRAEQGSIDAYLSSAGTAADEALLLASGWWQRGYQDGRSSRAMFELVRALGDSDAFGQTLRVILIDDPASRDRDRAMADVLAVAIGQRPEDLYIVLTGNLHNRLVPGRTEPMGYQLSRLELENEIVALEITHGGGTAWVCTSDGCGVLSLRGREGEPGVQLYAAPDASAYTGRLHVGSVTASPPARDP